VRTASLPSERPCKPEPEAAPEPVAPVTPESAAPEFEEPAPQTFAAAALPRETVSAIPAIEEPRPVPVEAPPPVAPEPAPVAVASQEEGRYSLQVGAFRKPENSEKVIQALQSKGYEPYVIEERGRSVLKTVRIGRFMDRGEALKAASDFRRREGMEAIVRPIG
jgi:DedD protein